MEHGIEYRNPTFTDAEYYVSPCETKTNTVVKILSVNILFGLFRNSSFVKKYFCIAWLVSLSGLVKFVVFNKGMARKNKDCEKTLLNAFEKKAVVFTGGWSFRVPHLIEKHRSKIEKKYSLKPEFYENNDFYKKIMKIKQKDNILIAIHIRRGDYKKWQGGKYYFEDNVYEKYMRDFSQKLSKKDAREQMFIIFSNDGVKFTENENLLVSKEKWYIDQHIMSICDYIIGPRSTFTLWANFMGDNTLFCIQDDSGNIDNTITDFRENDYAHAFSEAQAKKICEAQGRVSFLW
jgi:hypothetical protein